MGGHGTRRTDGDGKSGWSGAVCVFPEGHSSEWQITETFRFVHLYVSDDALRAAFSELHDCDARRLSLEERTLDDIPDVGQLLDNMAQATLARDVLRADANFAELVATLPQNRTPLSGGLTARVLRLVDDWIEAHLSGDIRLKDLAELAGLSEFHFHRMFRQSRGVPPHRWVTMQRVARATSLLADTPLAQVATACGFSSQSHLTRTFKSQVGVTPAQYKRQILT